MADNQHGLAVVTGASSGIGLALAGELAAHGFDLVVAAEDDLIDDVPERLSDSGRAVVAVRADLATFDGVELLVDAVRTTGQPVEAAAINAGVGVGGAFVEGRVEDHLRLIALNVSGAVQLTGRLLPEMVARQRGHLLYTSSIAATMPGPFASTYNASKSFLYSFAEAIRIELADSGVTVTALMPGPTDTRFFERAGIEDTRLGRSRKDDPTDVARQGVEAMLAGKDHVVAGSFRNRAQVAAAKVLPDSATAKAHAAMARPGSAKSGSAKSGSAKSGSDR